MRLKGKNFQPWADFELEVDKLTVIVGPSNKGKSALFRALKGVLRNELPAAFVRDGQKEPMELTLEVDNHIVVATRSHKGSTSYNIDSKPFTSLGGKLPEDIEKLRFNEVKLGSTSIDPIFGVQNEAQFLIDPRTYKPSDVNAVLGAFASTERLDAGRKEANLRVTQKNSEAKTLAAEVHEAEERKAKLSPMVEEGDALFEALDELEKDIRLGEKQGAWLLFATQHRNRLSTLRTAYNGLEPPDLETAKLLETKAQTAVDAAERQVYLRFLTKFSALQDQVAESWTGILVDYKKGRALEELTSLLSKKDDSLGAMHSKLAEVLSQFEVDYSLAVAAQGSIKQLAELAAIRQGLDEQREELVSVKAQVTSAEAEAQSLLEQLAAEKAKVKRTTCPKCGYAFSEDECK